MRFKKVSAEHVFESGLKRVVRTLVFKALFRSAQVPHNINFREKKSKLRKDKKAEGAAAEDSVAAKGRISRFRYFEDISGYSGVL